MPVESARGDYYMQGACGTIPKHPYSSEKLKQKGNIPGLDKNDVRITSTFLVFLSGIIES